MTFNFLKKIKIPLIDHILEGRFLFLLIFLLVYFALIPFFENFVGFRFLLDIFFSAVLISALYAVCQKKSYAIIGTTLAVPVFSLVWITHWVQAPSLTVLKSLFGILFLIYLIVIILKFIFNSQEVTRNVICAAIVVYLFLGLTWSFFYTIFETLQPGSFSMAQSQSKESLMDFAYYSFVTLTTLGYGDITPLSTKVKVLSMLEAVIGQIYLVVLVARLVGLHIAHSSREKN